MRRPVFLIPLLIPLALLALAGCGRNSLPNNAGLAAEAIQAKWIQALRDNDRQTARSLMVPELAPLVDRALGQIQGALTSPALGALKSVDVQPLRDQGQGKSGVSVWAFEKATMCFRTDLTATGSGWKVVQWTELTLCGATR